MWNNNDCFYDIIMFYFKLSIDELKNALFISCNYLELGLVYHIHQHQPLSIIDPNFLTLDSGASNKFAMGELSEFSFNRAGPGPPQKYKKPLLIEESKS